MHPLVHLAAQSVQFPVINEATAIATGPRDAISQLPCGGELIQGIYVILGLGWICYTHEVWLMLRTLSWQIWSMCFIGDICHGGLKVILSNCSYQFVYLVDITFMCLPAAPSSSSLFHGGDGLICFISATLWLTAVFHDRPFKCSVTIALSAQWFIES